MTDDSSHAAPTLGEPTDADLGDETASFLLANDEAHHSDASGDAAQHEAATQHEQTMETPDDLGGTGGEQEGGAG